MQITFRLDGNYKEGLKNLCNALYAFSVAARDYKD